MSPGILSVQCNRTLVRLDGPVSPDSLTPVDLNLIKDLWVPNVFIYNLKTFKVSRALAADEKLPLSGDRRLVAPGRALGQS